MTKTHINYAFLILLFVFAVLFVHWYIPVRGIDWKEYFRPSAQSIIHMESPYGDGFYNAPWALLPLIPISFLSPEYGGAVLYALNIFCFVFAGFKLKMNPISLIVFLLFSGMIWNSNNGNIEGILSLGFILPPQIGLFFVLAKPQFGIGVALYWGVVAWTEGGNKKVFYLFLPVSIAFLFSFLVFGFWPAYAPILVNVSWNSSIFPYGIPIGLLLLTLAIIKKKPGLAIASSPFFAPYLTGHTWAVVWFGVLSLL